ncbi:unnamed protein product [Brassica napus]|uniref:(rape) hypothetical protein n=1 Tax=Brassica napus TaxID=3708 RepID=A0A817AVG6_BRANA|nr:unnamed protein product [Brassica napus]
MRYPFGPGDHRIMTLGTMGMRWRKIKCSLRHEYDFVIVCFDVRSEKFMIYQESSCKLINYNGKLGVIYYDDQVDDYAIELRVWVLEDVETQEWSKYAYTLRDDRFFLRDVFVVGVNSTGEIVLSMAKYTSNQPFYDYFNPEMNTLQRVEIPRFWRIP